MTTTGVFTLTSPRDLLDKLLHDVEVVKANPSDAYGAYNMVVTAEHMLDWVYPGRGSKEKKRRHLRDSHPLLALISHLANGAKHFASLQPHHQSVDQRGSEVLNAPIVVSAASGSRVIYPPISHLVVHLDGRAKEEYGSYIRVTDLALAVSEYWSKHFAAQLGADAP